MKNSNDTVHVHAKKTDDIYRQNGYKDRRDYLKSVAGQYGTDRMVVGSMAEPLGETEDFDGLISALEDFPLL
ncbi:RNA polymerase [Dysgonomonas sp. GY75]|uniref:RNA polymerase n=1 Tax=Dysgonomonas sp. GY75 TaxID=2780419 RepID=UPI0018831294|nr:RNA polymerase [Dysgonomonas sp. GY75]MBF0650762.1 RNA polymerase [Dysgonomonas sp. GY75]